MDYTSLSDADLRALAKQRGIPAIGRRQDLITRLTGASSTPASACPVRSTPAVAKSSPSPVKTQIASVTSAVSMPRPVVSRNPTAASATTAASSRPAVSSRAVQSAPAVGGTDYNKMTVAQLKELLGDRQLKKTGNKPELVARLQDFDSGKSSPPKAAAKPASKPSAAAAKPKPPKEDDELSVGSIESVDDESVEAIDYSKLKVKELQEILKSRKLKITGRRDELIERLEEYDEAHGIEGLDSDDDDTDDVNGDDASSISDLTDVSVDFGDDD